MERPRRVVRLLSNYFSVEFNTPIYQYKLDLLDHLDPTTRNDIIKAVLRANRDNLRRCFGDHYVILNWAIYSYAHSENMVLTEGEARVEVAQIARLAPNDDTARNLLGRMVKLLQERVRLKRVGRKLFDPSKATTIDQLEIWPGYATTFVQNAHLSLLNIDSTSKVITNLSVLDFMNKVKQQSGGNLEDALNAELTGKSVLTVYNRRIYRIDAVVLNKTAADTFILDDGREVTFQAYYQDKYKVSFSAGQPLLKHVDKRTQKEILLIPELCVMTGLNDQQRADRGLMTRMSDLINPPAPEKLARAQALINTLTTQEQTKKFIADWKMRIATQPLALEAERLPTGQMLFGGNVRLDVEASQNLDRDTQQKMLFSKALNKIVVFYGRNTPNEHNSFMGLFQAVLAQYGVTVSGVESVQINDMRNFAEIKAVAHERLNPQVSLCIWILQGRKNAGINYEQIKRHLITNLPVPSQMILASTISAGKNLRSIITKLLVQIGAKVGSVPWAMSDLPFVDRPTMIIGIDTYQKLSLKCEVFSLVATVNRTYSTYWSNSAFSNPNFTLEKFLLLNIQKAVEKFKKDNGITPHNVILMRDGVSFGDRKRVKEVEVAAIRQALVEARARFGGDQEINLVFVTANKTCGAKFFLSNNPADPRSLGNPVPGTYVHQLVTDNENEFYLISQQTRRGLASPTSYYILENDMSARLNVPVGQVRDLIALLVFKLAYMYYNTSGSIKIPAPIHYAHKLSYMVGDKSSYNERIIPHQHLAEILSLYFI